MDNERTVTLTKKRLVEVLAEASSRHIHDLLEAGKERDGGESLHASMAALLIGAEMAKHATAILFPPEEGDTEAKTEDEQ